MFERKFAMALPTIQPTTLHETFARRRLGAAAAAACVSLLPLGPIEIAGPAMAGEIRFVTGPVATSIKTTPEVAAAMTALAFRDDARHLVVQFKAPLTRDQRSRIEDAGLDLQAPLADNAYFASLAPAADIAAVAGAGLVADAFAIEPVWKLHEYLAEGNLPVWAVVDRVNVGDGVSEAEFIAAVRAIDDPTIAVYVLLHPDVLLQPDAADLAARHGAKVVSIIESINGLVLELPFSRVWPLVSEDQVQYLEPALPPLKDLNDSNRERVGANTVHAPPYSLDGTGVNVLVYDGGRALATHQDFGGRLTVGATDTSTLSSHATHVSGTVGGSGAASGGLRKGMAPNVLITSFGFEQEGGLSQGFLYTDPGDLEDDYTAAINTYGADISNNSIGTNTSTNGYPCSWQGDYGFTDTLIDAIVRGSLGAPFRIVWANGNERQSSRCENLPPPHQDYHLTAPPACAKNHITVGALNSNDDSMTSFSSWGPADDGRMKPDVSAPGCESGGDNGVTSCNSSGSYSSLCGTSMASPTVCGLAALLLQDFRAHYPGDPDPRNSTLKVIFAQTAVDVFEPGPDYKSGYGSVRIQPAVDLLRAGNFIEDSVSQGETYQLLIVVNPGDPELRVTLAWDDAPGTPNVSPALVNDLDLRVFAPGGAQLFPWTLNPAVPSANAVQTVADHLNNIEQVYLASPAPGVYNVEVLGFNVPLGSQPFSLAGGPVIVDCSPSGIITLDRARYACASEATLQVVDCDLNTNDGAIESVNVTIASTSEPGGETVTLTETGAETASFRGAIALATTNAPGVLLISPGDVVTATYIDADDGQGGMNVAKTDVADVDCTAAVVSGVNVTEIEPRSATIGFTTNEQASAVVHIGTDCSSLVSTVAGSGFHTSHSIPLSDLDDDTTYYFAVVVTDQAGNVLTADNGGSCFTFSTPEVPDFLTEEFTGDNDLDNRTIAFTPNGSIDFYAACGYPIATLPTDPTGGTVVSLTNNGVVQIALTGGATVKLYGENYSSVWINANGNLTFTASDTDSTETLTDHFDTPRVSALFDDLNPAAGGQVLRQQLADRFVVTWLNVPENTVSNQNTFQVEMFFDGRIQISWLSIAANDGIAGLSEGEGLSPDFFESDIVGVGSCGPRPPLAVAVNLATPVNTPLAITLTATDDGLPDPPASLTYVVTSLPARPLRDAGNNHLISAGELPYTLVNGGNQLTYAPGATFQGLDSFQFLADDGGVPPEGGNSNIASVAITVGGPQAVHMVNLDTDPEWTTMGQWAWGTPTGGGTHNLDPTGGFTGTRVYGYNLSGDYPNNLSPVQYLTSKPFNCSGFTNTELRFRRWLGIESASFDHATIDVSPNGINWTNIWTHTGPAVSESGWSLQTFSIAAVADNQPEVFIRWGMGTTDGSVTYPGWNIDDIQLWALVPLGPIPGDLNDDGVVDVSDLLELLAQFGSCPPPGACSGDLDVDGDVDVNDLLELLANWTAPLTGEAAGGLAEGGDVPFTPRDSAKGDADAPVADEPGAYINDGLLAPADAGGVVEIDRNFIQTERGTLAIELAGGLPVDEHDLVVVSGEAALGGTLTVSLAEGFAPAAGQRFVILAADSIRGEFTDVILPARPHTAGALAVEYGESLVALVSTAPVAETVEPRQPTRLAFGRIDLDGDGTAGVGDVAALLHSWGGGTGAADLNDDRVVDGRDLRLLLESWH